MTVGARQVPLLAMILNRHSSRRSLIPLDRPNISPGVRLCNLPQVFPNFRQESASPEELAVLFPPSIPSFDGKRFPSSFAPSMHLRFWPCRE